MPTNATEPNAVEVVVVERDGKQYTTVTEGKATILVPKGAKVGEDRGEVQQVFYNPIQQYNRDLSVLAIKTYGEQILETRSEQFAGKAKHQSKKRKRDADGRDGAANGASKTQTETQKETRDVPETEGQESQPEPRESQEAKKPSKPSKPSFKILDALAASGLRGLRYAHELQFVTEVKSNDLSASAAKSIKLNVSYNGLEDKISVSNDDALAHMYRAIADDLSNRDRRGNPGKAHKFDVIDLDPYGTAAPFFDAAVQAVRDDGGLLCITCTDSAVWAGHSYCEKAFALYGGIPIHGQHSHEAGLRLVLNAIATSAARYGLAIEPLLSLSIDFYTKFFIKVTKAPNAVKFLAAKTMVVYSCDHGCGAWETQPLLRARPTPNKKSDGMFYKHGMALGPVVDRFCEHCGSKTHINGPMYAGRIHNQDFIQRLLDQIPQADPAIYKTLPRLEGMLRTALDEHLSGPPAAGVDNKQDKLAEVDPYPFFVNAGKLSGVLSCSTPPDDMFRGALIHLGYQVGRSHCRPGSVKTDAPWSTIWWVLTEWIRQKSPIKTSKFTPLMPAWKILHGAGIVGVEESKKPEAQATMGQDSEMQVDEPAAPGDHVGESAATEQPQSEEVKPTEIELRKTLVFNHDLARLARRPGQQKFLRYQENPRPNWGPLNKAKAS